MCSKHLSLEKNGHVNKKEYIWYIFILFLNNIFHSFNCAECEWLCCICFVHSKVSRPDHLALHVFEVDEDVDKDEVREITNTQYRLYPVYCAYTWYWDVISESHTLLRIEDGSQ